MDGQSKAFEKLNEAFEHLPLAAVVDDHIFCVHGGICPDLTLDKIKKITKPLDLSQIPNKVSVPMCMLWSDPEDENMRGKSIPMLYREIPYPKLDGSGFADNYRGVGKIYGEQAVKEFYEKNSGLGCIVRAHECVPGGHNTKFETVHTVFSSPDYGKFPDGQWNTAKILIYDSKTKEFSEEVIPGGGKEKPLKDYIDAAGRICPPKDIDLVD